MNILLFVLFRSFVFAAHRATPNRMVIIIITKVKHWSFRSHIERVWRAFALNSIPLLLCCLNTLLSWKLCSWSANLWNTHCSGWDWKWNGDKQWRTIGSRVFDEHSIVAKFFNILCTTFGGIACNSNVNEAIFRTKTSDCVDNDEVHCALEAFDDQFQASLLVKIT